MIPSVSKKTIFGLLLLGLGCVAWWVDHGPTVTKLSQYLQLGLVGSGLFLTVPHELAAGVKEVGGAIGDAWKSRGS